MPSVLLVHDDASTRGSVVQALRAMGFQVTAQPDAVAGWTEILQDAFDLILWDAAQLRIEGEGLPSLLEAAGQQVPAYALTVPGPHGADRALDETSRAGMDLLTWSGQVDEAWRQVLSPLLPQDGPPSRWEGLTFDALPGFERLLARYRQRLPGQMAEIRAAWTQQDRVSLQHLAHALKGTAECFGLPEVSRLAAQIEHTAAQGASAVVDAWVGQLDTVVREAVGADGGTHAAGESV